MKKFLSVILSLVMVSMLSVCAYAAEPVPSNDLAPTSTAQEEISPRIYWNGTAQLSTGSWNNITASNNIFPDSPLITSDPKNPGTVTVRVLNDKGEQVGGTKTMQPGESARLDQIPAFSGTYTIQGKVILGYGGTYKFIVD